ncbi:MAG: winged helix-turn-helix transcriptional regulator [Anaerolineaceae bacterium]|nr:MAG: winged helix-turn-helix transcriptional regulator [Anaerolineaceae bacterium]
MSVTTARQRVLAQLGKSGRASARELARTLRMSEANVRHHLRVLASDGRVTVALLRAEGRGRPEKVFSLSAALTGDNLAGLAEALLSVEGFTLNVEGLASRILDASQFTNLPISRRLALLVERLNEKHYQARWEAGAEGPRVIFGKCPYAAVIEGHPELCQMDALILSQILGGDVRQIEKIEKGRGVCIFSIR